MKIILLRFALICSVFGLLSCSVQQPLRWSPQCRGHFAQCKMSCDQRKAACSKTCRNNCAQCSTAANNRRVVQYNHYVHEQRVKGKNIALQLNSFRDPLQCRKVTCNCAADYQICLQSCGGVIQKTLKNAPLCS